MKKLFALTILILVVMFAAVSVCAANSKNLGDISFSINDDYDVKTAEHLPLDSTVDGLVFVAISSDGKHQIQARCITTDFSKQLGSFSGLDAQIVAPVGEQLFPDGYETATINNIFYIKNISFNGDDSTVVYVTVANRKLYTFTYFGSDPSRIGEFMGTVNLPQPEDDDSMKTLSIVVISVFIVADVIFVIFLILSFVKDYRQRKMERNENIVSNYIKIKRRKF